MSTLADVTTAPLQDLLGNRTEINAVLAINGAAAATVKTTNAISYVNNGIYLSKTALSAQSIAVTHYLNGTTANAGGFGTQPIGTTVYYTLSLDGSGNVHVSQGDYLNQQLYMYDVGASAFGTGNVPLAPVGDTVFGLIKVVAVSAAFTPGTTALDNAGLTVTYFNLANLPATNP